MDKDKNLEELLLAIGGGAGASAETPNTPAVPPPAPVPVPVPGPAAAVPNGAQAGNKADAKKYLNELVNLLGGSGDSPAPAAPVPATALNGFPRQPHVPATLTQPAQVARPMPVATQPAGGSKTPAALRAQQLLESQDLSKRAPGAAVRTPSPATAAAAAGAAAANAARGAGMDITAELNAVMSNNASSAAAKPKPARPVPPGGVRPPVRPAPPGAPGAGRQQPRQQITQEQIIVGHFCRHAIKTLSRVMHGKPEKQEAEARLKDHIKSIWAQWVRGLIMKQRLLESVATFVRSSCPEAATIDVIRDFKTWYEREFENQRRRTMENASLTPQERARRTQQLAQQQQRAAQQGRSALPQAQTQAQTAAARRAAANGIPANSAVKATPAAKTATPRTTASAKLVKPEPTTSPAGRTAGKSIGSKTLPTRGVPVAKGGAAKTVAGKTIGGKSTASKSVGGKSISRPPSAGSKSIMGSKTPSGAATAGGSKGKSAPKPKAPRKQVAKTPTKALPKAASVKQKPPPSAASPSKAPNPETVSVVPSVNGKRTLETNGTSPVGTVPKKVKAIVKGQKGAVARKKTPSTAGGAAGAKGTKVPPQRTDLAKGRPPKGPTPNAGTGPSPAAGAKGASGTTGTAPAGQGAVPKKVSRVDDELNVVNNIVDIDNEVDMLDRDAGGGAQEVVEVVDFSADMLLNGPRLRSKMQSITRRHGLNENVSTDTMEMVSLAVRERLACLLESLRDISAARVESNKAEWKTEYVGPNIFEQMKIMRESEERELIVAADLRIKRRKAQIEREAKKLAGEAAADEKTSKDASAAAESERKEKLALEKKRKEHSSQRDALSGVLAGIGKRRKALPPIKGLAPLFPIKGSQTELPPIVRKHGSVSPGSIKSASSKPGGPKGLKPLPAPTVTRYINGKLKTPETNGKKNNGRVPENKRPVTLRDCLFFMESEPNSRKGSLLYKWYARLGRPRRK